MDPKVRNESFKGKKFDLPGGRPLFLTGVPVVCPWVVLVCGLELNRTLLEALKATPLSPLNVQLVVQEELLIFSRVEARFDVTCVKLVQPVVEVPHPEYLVTTKQNSRFFA